MEEQQVYLTLIQQLLNCTTPEEFNQTLSDNQNLLNGNLIATLDQVIPLLREQGEEEEAQRCEYLAQGLRQMLGQDREAYLNLIQQLLECPSGEEGNILQAHTALEVYTREAFPVDWAMAQNNLGNAYNNRRRFWSGISPARSYSSLSSPRPIP